MKIYFVSRYSEIPRGDPSLPSPLSLAPPKGATHVLIMPSLTPTMPDSRLWMIQERRKEKERQPNKFNKTSNTSQSKQHRHHSKLCIRLSLEMTYPLLNRKARDKSLVQKYDAKPTRVSLAISKASSSVWNDRIGATGPNVSVPQICDFTSTLVKMVGA